MKLIPLTIASCMALSIVSCDGHRGPRVPDMPYIKKAASATPTPKVQANTAEPMGLSDAQLLPPRQSVTSPAPTPAPTPSVSPSTTSTAYAAATAPPAPITPAATVAQSNYITPEPASNNGPTETITVNSALLDPTPVSTASTVSIPTPAPVSTPAPTALPPENSTPVAKGVPGDPSRVYNPWNSNQKIRITDPKTGMPFPSGKILGIPGSTKKFIVP